MPGMLSILETIALALHFWVKGEARNEALSSDAQMLFLALCSGVLGQCLGDHMESQGFEQI